MYIQKFIPTLKVTDPNNTAQTKIIDKQKDLETEIREYYKTLYASRENERTTTDIQDFLGNNIITKTLTHAQRDKMEGLLTMEEMTIYTKQIKNNKSPGSTGYTGNFYKFFYNSIKHRLLKSINYSRTVNTLSTPNRLGIITLIPKGSKDQQLLKNWRPLTLLTTYYKIISGCIANRIKPALDTLIHPNQKAYLKGRNIGEVTRNTIDIMHYAKENNLTGLLLLIDFEKAFDSISFNYIKDTLKHFQFGDDIIGWITLLLKNFTAVTTHAGNISTPFNIARGCRQGDPIARYLFILCIEILSIKLRNTDTIAGFKMGVHTHLLDLYADDITLYLLRHNDITQTENNIRNTLKVFEDFKSLSGLKLNLDKTNIAWFGKNPNQPSICTDIPIKWTKDFTLLGLHFDTELKTLKDNFDKGHEKIKTMLNRWCYRDLTPYGKITIIKTLGLSKLTHIATAIPVLHHEQTKALEQTFFNFLWGRTLTNNAVNKVAKSDTMIPEKLGGMGMVNIAKFWQSLQLTWLRKLTTSNSFWVKILGHELQKIGYHINHILYSSSTELLHISNNLTNPYWAEILKTAATAISLHPYSFPKDIQLAPLCHNPLFTDNNTHIPKTLFQNGLPRQLADIIDPHTNSIKTLQEINEDFNTELTPENYTTVTNAVRNGCNSLGIILQNTHPKTNPRHTQLTHLLALQHKGCNKYNIVLQKKTHLEYNPAQIEAKWHTELNTTFSIQTWDKHWRKIGQIKYNNKAKWIQYQILCHCLKTNSHLHHMIPHIQNTCPFCEKENTPDTISHCMYNCDYTKQLWLEFKTLIENSTTLMNTPNTHQTVNTVLFGIKDQPQSTPLNTLYLYTKQYIWNTRFRTGTKPNIAGLKHKLLKDIENIKHIYTIRNQDTIFDLEWGPLLLTLASAQG